MTTEPEYIEPEGMGRAGWHKEGEGEGQARSYYRRLATPWETFIKSEGLPVFRGV